MNNARPLSGCVVGISVSEAEGMECLGFDRSEMNRCVVRLSESFLAAGARLAFGHDWRPGGVMEAVAALAVRYVDVRRDANGLPSQGAAPIINRVAAPDVPFLFEEKRKAGSTEHSVNPMVRLLDGIVDARQSETRSGVCRAEALSHMRLELAQLCHIRVCLGGKLIGYSGKMPGLIEEALGTLRQERLVLTSAIFGGASGEIVRAMEGKLEYHEFPREAEQISRLCPRVRPHLDEKEEQRLWHSNSTEECMELILRCAVKWWAGYRLYKPTDIVLP